MEQKAKNYNLIVTWIQYGPNEGGQSNLTLYLYTCTTKKLSKGGFFWRWQMMHVTHLGQLWSYLYFAQLANMLRGQIALKIELHRNLFSGCFGQRHITCLRVVLTGRTCVQSHTRLAPLVMRLIIYRAVIVKLKCVFNCSNTISI